jgi:hypothetical protein
MHYQFKGLIRWSKIRSQKINIHNISQMKCQKRIFCLLDKDKPYTLDIIHFNDNSLDSKFPPHQSIGLTSFRYSTLKECKDEIMLINRLKIIIPNKEISDNVKATK